MTAILRMSRPVFLLLALLLFTSLSQARAQSRMDAGLLLDYLSVSQTKTPNFGLGARFGYRVYPHVIAEGELAYDFGVNFNELYVNVANGNAAAIERTSIGVTDGLFGPMLEPASGHFRPFVTLKGGFIDFRLSPGLLPYGSVVTSVLGIRTSNVNAALYPRRRRGSQPRPSRIAPGVRRSHLFQQWRAQQPAGHVWSDRSLLRT
jgi:hypothetical protein